MNTVAPSPFLTNLVHREYDNGSISSTVPGVSADPCHERFLPRIERWVGNPHTTLSDLIREAKTIGATHEDVIHILNTIANILLQRDDTRGRAVKLISLLQPPSFDHLYVQNTVLFAYKDVPNVLVTRLNEKNYLKEVDLALEHGCGNGSDAQWLHTLGVRTVIGVDTSSTAIQRANEKVSIDGNGEGSLSFFLGTLEELMERNPHVRGRVNLVTSTSVIHLVSPDEANRFLQFVHQHVLAQGGRLAITIKSPNCFYNGYGVDDLGDERTHGAFRIESWKGGNSTMCRDGHPRWFEDLPAFAKRIEEAGFEIDDAWTEWVSYARDQQDEFVYVVARKP